MLAAKTLKTLLSFIVIVSITIAVFAQAYSRLLLNIYGGPMLSEGTGPTLLRVTFVQSYLRNFLE